MIGEGLNPQVSPKILRCQKRLLQQDLAGMLFGSIGRFAVWVSATYRFRISVSSLVLVR